MTPPLKKIQDTAINSIGYFFLLLGTSVFAVTLTLSHTRYACKKAFFLSNYSIVALSLLTIIIAISAATYAKNRQWNLTITTQVTWLFSINKATFFLFLVQAYIFTNTLIFSGWDAGGVYSIANLISKGSESTWGNAYLSRFPNNQLVVLFQALIIKTDRAIGVFGGDGRVVLVLIQCLLTSLTGKFLYEIIFTLSNSKFTAALGWIAFVILLGLSGWNVIPYTDMMGLIFPTAILKAYLSLHESNHPVTLWAIIVALAFWGYNFKPTTIIVVIALIITEFLFFRRIIGFNKRLFSYLAIVTILSLSVYNSIFNLSIEKSGLKINRELDTGALHMIMMGMNPVNHGVWYDKDVRLSEGFKNKEERRNAQIATIKQRLKDYGLPGFVHHMYKKTLIVFNDGTFAWGVEGGFYRFVPPDKNTKVAPFLKSIFFSYGSRHKRLSTIQQIVWISTLLFSLGIFFFRTKKEHFLIMLSLLGTILFNLLFEARARYLILYVPFFIIAATVTLHKIFKVVLKALSQQTNGQSRAEPPRG